MRRRAFLIYGGAVGAAFLSGCAPSPQAPAGSAASVPAVPPTPRPIPPTVARQIQAMPPAVREAYTFAIDRPDVLQWVPCYCGCDEQGHGSNLDCFVKPETQGGIVLDAHGSA
jgi:hypothetical protein